jgi:hypothetical protein
VFEGPARRGLFDGQSEAVLPITLCPFTWVVAVFFNPGKPVVSDIERQAGDRAAQQRLLIPDLLWLLHLDFLSRSTREQPAASAFRSVTLR